MYTLAYHELVVEKDISHLSQDVRTRIRRAIEEKLATEPTLFGQPLRQSLKGYRKLRVRDYRVVFCIRNTTVFIMLIAHRSVVYAHAEKRIGK